jgi:hypothetical protein
MVVASSAAVSATGRISPGAQLDVSEVGDIAGSFFKFLKSSEVGDIARIDSRL